MVDISNEFSWDYKPTNITSTGAPPNIQMTATPHHRRADTSVALASGLIVVDGWAEGSSVVGISPARFYGFRMGPL